MPVTLKPAKLLQNTSFLKTKIDLQRFDHNTKGLKSFSVPSLGFRHILNHLPLLQGSLPKNKGSSRNNFLLPTCQWRSEIIAPPKRQFLEQKNWTLDKMFVQINFQRRKMKTCKSPETRFPKVSRRSEPCSGGKRPFQVSKKIEIRKSAFEKVT